MTQRSWPFYDVSASSGTAVLEDQWSQMARIWSDSGVVDHGDALEVSADGSARSVEVATGRAAVRGHWYESDAVETLLIAANTSGNPRIDRVVLRLDPSADSVVLAVLEGTPAGSPSAPALTQTDAGVYELPLATVAVADSAAVIGAGNVTDGRGTLMGPALSKNGGTITGDLTVQKASGTTSMRVGAATGSIARVVWREDDTDYWVIQQEVSTRDLTIAALYPVIAALRIDKETGHITLVEADPTADRHAATKGYVDTEVAGVGVWQDWTPGEILLQTVGASPPGISWTPETGDSSCRYTRLGDTIHGTARGVITSGDLPSSTYDSRNVYLPLPVASVTDPDYNKFAGEAAINGGSPTRQAYWRLAHSTESDPGFRPQYVDVDGYRQTVTLATIRAWVDLVGTVGISYSFTYEAG